MSTYPTLSIGTRDTDSNGDVSKLQQALADNGYRSYLGNAGVDGIYGKNTAKAVAKYQSDNALQVDGIAGAQTLGHLYKTAAAPVTKNETANTGVSNAIGPTAAAPAVPDASQFAYDAAGNTGYTQAQAAADQARQELNALEDPYAVYAQQLRDSYDQYVNREPFSYDVNADALYQQYKDIYTTHGQLAMQDTMGQAAALTGGYGNTYAQNVGQQAYQGYLQQLNAIVPELYQMAYDRYSDAGNAMLNQYSLLRDMATDAYSHYRNQVSNGWQNVSYLQNQADTAYERGYQNWYDSLQLSMNADNTAYARQQDSYDRQQNDYDRLAQLIAMGYTPTQDDLTATGMTQSQANAIKNHYHPTATANTAATKNWDNGSYSKDEVKLAQAFVGAEVDGLWGSESQEKAAQYGSLEEVFEAISQAGETERAKAFLYEKGTFDTWRSRGITEREYKAMAEKWLSEQNFNYVEFYWLEQKFKLRPEVNQ